MIFFEYWLLLYRYIYTKLELKHVIGKIICEKNKLSYMQQFRGVTFHCRIYYSDGLLPNQYCCYQFHDKILPFKFRSTFFSMTTVKVLRMFNYNLLDALRSLLPFAISILKKLHDIQKWTCCNTLSLLMLCHLAFASASIPVLSSYM